MLIIVIYTLPFAVDPVAQVNQAFCENLLEKAVYSLVKPEVEDAGYVHWSNGSGGDGGLYGVERIAEEK